MGIASHMGAENISPSRWQTLVGRQWPEEKQRSHLAASPVSVHAGQGTQKGRLAKRSLLWTSNDGLGGHLDDGDRMAEGSNLSKYSQQLDEVEKQIRIYHSLALSKDRASNAKPQMSAQSASRTPRTARAALGISTLTNVGAMQGTRKRGGRVLDQDVGGLSRYPTPSAASSSSALDVEAKRLLERVKLQLSGGAGVAADALPGSIARLAAGNRLEGRPGPENGPSRPRWTGGTAGGSIGRRTTSSGTQEGAAGKERVDKLKMTRHDVPSIDDLGSRGGPVASTGSRRDWMTEEATSTLASAGLASAGRRSTLLPIETMLDELELQATMQRLLQGASPFDGEDGRASSGGGGTDGMHENGMVAESFASGPASESTPQGPSLELNPSPLIHHQQDQGGSSGNDIIDESLVRGGRGGP